MTDLKAKQLLDILEKTKVKKIEGDDNVTFTHVSQNSRAVDENTVFVAIKGNAVDGHNYISGAILKGTKVVICSALPNKTRDNICYVVVDNTRLAIGEIAHALVGNPGRDLKLIGITGTNGKTSVCTLLYQLYKSLGYRVGLISTVENRVNDEVILATHTTPDASGLAFLLSKMRDQKCSHVFMEVSSHAIDQGRILGVDFDVAGFTNISRDHLDYHGNFKNYIATKKKFFDGLKKEAFAIVNADDVNGKIMLDNCKATHKYYSLRGMADYNCRILYNSIDGLQLKINGVEAYMLLSGKFNAYNLTCVFGIAQLLGENEEEILIKMSMLKGAEGRLQKVTKFGEERIGIVDYAHTPDALENVLMTLKELKSKSSKLITVFGCGGDRDKGKRPMMGKIASRYSDRVVITSDNPRSEDPGKIIEEIVEGVEVKNKVKVVQIPDRAEAIKTAIMISNKFDIILVAGKGHEKYQEIGGKKFPFEDTMVLSEAISKIR